MFSLVTVPMSLRLKGQQEGACRGEGVGKAERGITIEKEVLELLSTHLMLSGAKLMMN